jgi:hypothetical protein
MARFIHAIDQYERHQTNKAQRRGNGKEIEFGLETFLELKEREWDEYLYSFDDECTCEECIGFNWRDRLKVS